MPMKKVGRRGRKEGKGGMGTLKTNLSRTKVTKIEAQIWGRNQPRTRKRKKDNLGGKEAMRCALAGKRGKSFGRGT